MKRLLLGLALCAPLTGCAQDMSWGLVERMIRSDFPAVEQLPADTLAAWLDDGARPILLDVRTADEYAVSHLPGAVRVDPDAEPAAVRALLDSLSAERATARPVVLYCSVGYRSSALAERLQEAGVDDVANLERSIFGWANAGRPVVRAGTPVRQVHPFDGLWGRLLDAELRAYTAE